MESGVVHQTIQNVGQVTFDSKFSSGNLLRAEKNPLIQDGVMKVTKAV